jgi:tight adherence protein B
VFWIALLLLIIGLVFVVILLLGTEKSEEDGEFSVAKDADSSVPQFLQEYLANNGVELPAVIIYGSLASGAAIMILSLVILPINLGALIAALVPATLYLAVKGIGNHRRAKMQEQLPSFVNQVTRRLSAGVSVENAFADSVETLERPLGTVLRRVVRRVHMGYELHQAFEREAAHTKLHEFNVLATAIRINEQYGGSIRSILEDIVDILRLEEAGKRELAAMTGETRFTAFVLALLPPGLVGYLFFVKPEMILETWAKPSGQSLLIVGLMLEILGVFILWRMVKSIGT